MYLKVEILLLSTVIISTICPSVFSQIKNSQNLVQNPNSNQQQPNFLGTTSWSASLNSEGWNEEISDLIFKNVSDICKHQFSYAVETFSLMPHKIPETWVLQLFDSWGKLPSGILSGHTSEAGDFFECLQLHGKLLRGRYENETEDSIKGRYCLTAIAPATKLLKIIQAQGNITGQTEDSPSNSKGSVSLPLLVKYILDKSAPSFAPIFGTCFPHSCSSTDVKEILESIHEHLLGNYTTQNVVRCYTDEKVTLKARDYVMIVVLGLLTTLCLASSFIDVYRKDEMKQGRAVEIVLAFSVYTNTKKWLSTKTGSDNLGRLHGIRFLTMAWILLAHTYVLATSQFLWNKVDLKNVYKDWTVYPILNGFPSVDTFLTVSGILVAYNLLKELDRKNGRFNYFLYVLHRYLRLTPPYAILLGLLATLLPYTGSGPMWANIETLSERCRRYWWQNFLYLSNVIENKDGKCFGAIAWYLPIEMQIFVFSPVVVYPLWKWKRVGLGNVAVMSIIAVFIPTYLTATASLTPTNNIPAIARGKLTYWENYYDKPWGRLGSYLVGMIVGYLLYLQKKRPGFLGNIPILAAIACWALSTALVLAIIYGAMPFYDPKNIEMALHSAQAAAYGGFHRVTWSLCIGWIIFDCVNGYGWWVNKLLSAKIFMPLGRLAFTMYLVSYHVEIHYFFQSIHPIRYTDYNILILNFGLMSVIGFGAYILFIMTESPFMRLEKMLLVSYSVENKVHRNNYDEDCRNTKDDNIVLNSLNVNY